MLDDKRLELMKKTTEKANEAHQTKIRIDAEHRSIVKAGGETVAKYGGTTLSNSFIAELEIKAEELEKTLLKEEEEAENQVRVVAEHEELVSRLSLS